VPDKTSSQKSPRRKAKLTVDEAFDAAIRLNNILGDHCERLSILAQDSRFSPEQRRILQEASEKADERFSIALDRPGSVLPLLAKTSQSTELLCNLVNNFLILGKAFPQLLERYEKVSGEDMAEAPDGFVFRFAEVMVLLTQFLEVDCQKHPERYRHLAQDLPYWPALVFRHKAANNHLFAKSGSGTLPVADLIELGRDCPINISGTANYSLQTPINAYLWKILQAFQSGHRTVGWFRQEGRKTHRNETEQHFMVRVDLMSDAEAELYSKTFGIPSLRKSTAGIWADRAILPFILLTNQDMREIPVFSKINTGPSGRRYAPVKRAITKALGNLAYPG
jgi:hypothetical protein